MRPKFLIRTQVRFACAIRCRHGLTLPSLPLLEGTSAGLLNAAAQVVGLAFTFGATAIIELSGDIAANTMLSLALVVGTLLTYLIKADLRRQRASQGAAPLCHSISITPSELSNK